ncbi:phage terminase large subunit [Amycolatopsis sp., V23-08]|uniref:Phage terminase large subunit n=1 Tax=Amycolatopsis heterodermiae TaxID=3110235 RepID=A0ABU5RK36_9PSEU|nr:phage terminase large subunit [Amycolatopsis sp., V23-08]MEA5366089.1 phage terminase large subunit [Amycolatopsis sp., V23-08]
MTAATFELLLAQALEEQVAEAARPPQSLGEFTTSVDPRNVQTPALDLLDEKLAAVARGEIKRLIISMPPQEGKSQRVSRRFPAWMLKRNPELRIAITSYELGVARRWGRQIRNDLAEHPEIGLKVRSDTSAAHEWQLEGHDGGVYSVGIGGPLTGRPVDLLIIDDPIKDRAQADSQTQRDSCWEWWTNVARTRFASNTAVVIIMTRWHEDDLAGRLISTGDWDVVNIPAQAESEEDPLGREPGEYLTSTRGRTTEEWEAIEKDVGPRVWGALYQGNPSPADGDLLKRGWWQFYPAPQAVEVDGVMQPAQFDKIIQSWDFTFDDTKSSDFVVGQVWGRRGADVYLLDQVRDRMDFPTTVRAVQAMTTRWPDAHTKLIEKKANGAAVIKQLKSKVSGIVAITPTESKEARVAAVSDFVEAGNVYVPSLDRDDASFVQWSAGFVEECASFPNGSHDDQVDAMSQALARLLVRAAKPNVRWL